MQTEKPRTLRHANTSCHIPKSDTTMTGKNIDCAEQIRQWFTLSHNTITERIFCIIIWLISMLELQHIRQP